MKNITILLLVLLLCAALPVLAQEKEMAEKKMDQNQMAAPQALDNAWYNWLVGEWTGWSESPMGKSDDWMQFDYALNNQFLMLKYKGKMAEMTDEQMKTWKTSMNLSDEDVQKVKDSVFKGIGMQTINPQTGEVTGYWFDSWRNISKGSGKIADNKETMTWQSAMGTGTRTVEKVGPDKFVVSEKWTMPDGNVMESKSEFTRKTKETTEK